MIHFSSPLNKSHLKEAAGMPPKIKLPGVMCSMLFTIAIKMPVTVKKTRNGKAGRAQP